MFTGASGSLLGLWDLPGLHLTAFCSFPGLHNILLSDCAMLTYLVHVNVKAVPRTALLGTMLL